MMKKVVLFCVGLTCLIACNFSEKEVVDDEFKSSSKQVAMSTQKELGRNLKSAIKEKGMEGAVAFCNLQALNLTQKMADSLGYDIKRVSDKNRNPLNKANAKELAYIGEIKEVSSEQATPKYSNTNHKKTAYYPIFTNALCLGCHGSENQISPSVKELLAQKYPSDLAVGYGIDELRGIWVIAEK